MQQRAAIYCRVSTPGQQDNGSLDDQEKHSRAYCAEHGYTVLEPPYREVFSADDIDRPLLDTLRDEIRAGRVDVVVSDKVDRFSRADPAITAYFMVEAEQYGAKVEFCEVKDDSFEGQILTAVLAIVARVELRRIKERTTSGKRRRVLGDASKDKPARLLPGNIPRYGWRYADKDKSRYIRVPEHVAVMERIYTELGIDRKPLRAICRDLEADGILPPTLAQVRAGYDIGKRKVTTQWNPKAVAHMLAEPCYWGEAEAYRNENYKAEKRERGTHRIRKVRRTRLRERDSDLIVRYPPEVWPGIVSKELAMKALARLEVNKGIQERKSMNSGMSYLRAGLIVCGYCGDHMTLQNHKVRNGLKHTLRFVCSRRMRFHTSRPTVTSDCPAGGLVSVRVEEVEAAVWVQLQVSLSDPDRVPDAYDRLKAKEGGVQEARDRRAKILADLIAKARARLNRLADALVDTDDPDMRALFKEKAMTETASIRTWEQEKQSVEMEAADTLAETAEVRDWMSKFIVRAYEMGQFTREQQRKLAQAIGLRVTVYKPDHTPWIAMSSDLPGVEASWHAVRAGDLPTEGLLNMHMETAATSAGMPVPRKRDYRMLVPIADEVPVVPSSTIVLRMIVEKQERAAITPLVGALQRVERQRI